MSATIPMGSIALALSQAGMYVFPVWPGQKRPAIKTGLKGATRNPKKITSWWAKIPNANIGIATEPSGLVVVDCDAGKPWPGPGEPGIGVKAGDDVLIGIAEDAGADWLWATPTVLTPSGGLHLYFRAPEGVVIRSRANIAPWVDVRAAGGYVVGPFSRTKAGYYRPSGGWETVVEVDAKDFRPIGIPVMRSISFDPPALPDWLVELLTTKEAAQGKDLDVLDVIRKRLDRAPVGSSLGYAEAALRNEAEKVRSAANGTRNQLLNEAAFAVGTLVGAGMLDGETVGRELESAARAVGLVDDDGIASVRATIGSGLRAGRANPRQVSTP